MRFRGIVQLNGKTAAGIPVPVEVVESLGSGKEPPVRVTNNGYTSGSTAMLIDPRASGLSPEIEPTELCVPENRSSQ